MSIQQGTLQALQKTGEMLHATRIGITQDLQDGSLTVVSLIRDQPLGADADRAYARLRSVGKLAHELQAMEEQLKRIFSEAAQLVQVETPTVIALAAPRASRSPEQESQVMDVSPRPAQTELKGNPAKLMQYFKQKLNRKSWMAITIATISEESGIPKGSIASATRKLIDDAHVVEGKRGHYKLP